MMGDQDTISTRTQVTYWDLARACLWLGLTCYGGPAMVGYVREVMVERLRWLQPKEFAEGLALSQIVPGATLTQVITYVGLVLRGPAGAAVAATCFILPGMLIVLGVSALYFRWQDLPLVLTLSRGIGAVVIALLAYASLRLARSSLPSVGSYVIAAAACLAYLFRINAFLVVLAAAALAWLFRRGRETAVGPAPAETNIERVAPTVWVTLAVIGSLGLLGVWHAAPTLGRLCLAFLGIGSVAFGGGYSMIPLIQQQVVDKLGVLSVQAFLDGIALGQVTPGPIMLTATFIGYAVTGLLGGLAATVAIFSPSWVILVAAAPHFHAWSRKAAVQVMIHGIVASFVGMLVSILVRLGGVTLTDVPSVLLAVAAFIAFSLGVDLPIVVVAGMVLSLALFR
ncbi:MAG TPA: chromate efflux transporter [Candidatus Methylomirabilis sp.]|nr:chromate efflux transporter [Candidatus Methylomirabilis sp.]